MNLLTKYGITEDRRFVRARREAVLTLCIVLLEMVWVFGFALWGYSSSSEEYTYVLGLPLWLFFTLIGTAIIGPLAGIILVGRITNDSLESVVEHGSDKIGE